MIDEHITKIHAVVDMSHDGYSVKRIFKRECNAKTFCKKLNKKAGFDQYTIIELEMDES